MKLFYSYLVILIYSLFILACKKNGQSNYYYQLDFIINEDATKPIILSDASVHVDSSFCHSFNLGENIKIKTNSTSTSLVLLLNDKIIGSNKGEFVLNKSGKNIICLKDTISMAQISKCINGINPNNPKTKPIVSKFDCAKVFFTNSRFDGTISGLPDGQYRIQVIENQYPRSYILYSSKGQGQFSLNTRYEARPTIELKKLEKTNPPIIKCLF